MFCCGFNQRVIQKIDGQRRYQIERERGHALFISLAATLTRSVSHTILAFSVERFVLVNKRENLTKLLV